MFEDVFGPDMGKMLDMIDETEDDEDEIDEDHPDYEELKSKCPIG